MTDQYEEYEEIMQETEIVKDEPTYEPVNSYTDAPASWNIRYYMAGFDCQLTLRDMSGSKLLQRAGVALNKLQASGAQPERTMRSTPTQQTVYAPSAPIMPAGYPMPAPVQPPAPAPAAPKAAEPTELEWIKVESITHAVTDSGHHYIKVKGGRYSKFGVKAWVEAINGTQAEGYVEWPIGTEYGPLPGMEVALVADGKKVQRFNNVQA
jgi:hypothetical protein